MQRNMDLIRDILLEVESYAPARLDEIQGLLPSAFSGTQAENSHNIQLLIDDGFLKQFGGQDLSSGAYYVDGLTMKGHDFLDAVRDKSVWEATKARVEQVGGFTLDIFLAVAKDYLKMKFFGMGD